MKPPLPKDFHPCCLPIDAIIHRGFTLQFDDVFHPNIIGKGPKKDITTRLWGRKRVADVRREQKRGSYTRVGGTWHKNTIGWVTFDKIEPTTASATTQEICDREGRPNMTPDQFNKAYLLKDEVRARLYPLRNGEEDKTMPPLRHVVNFRKAVEENTCLWRVVFSFVPCPNHIH
jgi:hypothetical protein